MKEQAEGSLWWKETKAVMAAWSNKYDSKQDIFYSYNSGKALDEL